ncbi:WecB/TagA/CpsF family glycosyltransferase [Paenirhodobacter populi]|uniref:Glycosyltransferase n=1 Tax=Paenirhodobacter populi TaxID=2306993 RepID=A0A443JBS9_9RHOB|nr:WecB/TagA/CpsF family glycosyltransferase [Sinirhodobacter populi]RWR18007.1 glycosyltransferase [Sinirhodobacter populi]
MPDTVEFLALDFTVASPSHWRDRLLAPPPATGFRYLVTPNVDHVVQLSKQPDLAPVYDAADWKMCDSRILEKLGRMRGLELGCYPGADLVRDLMQDPRSGSLKIAVVGPDAERFRLLREKFPGHDLHLVEAPFMKPGSPEWERTLQATEAVQADLTLLCISFPKQEIFARDLKARGHARGTAICAGASIDFLTGQQKRAPEIFRKTSTEWLYRLLSQPGRLWKRYLIDGPRIFAIYLKEKG